LVDNVVLSIAIEPAGNKRFGTSEGISRFDGTNWTTYTTDDGLTDDYVSSIAIDSEGIIWFGIQAVLSFLGNPATF
jgi:streptogramin lyase